MVIYPYKQGSKSAKDLAEGLGIKRIKHEGSKFKGRPDKVVINWGCSELPLEVEKCKIINQAWSVKLASNKLSCFKQLNGVARIPEFFLHKGQAQHAILDGKIVVCRTILNGNSGAGIVIAGGLDELVDAPLYTVYVPKKEEYRVHICNNEVVDVQRKARRKDVEEVNWQVRNLANGFIFAREEGLGNVPIDVLDQAKKAVAVCKLDFGAVDVIWNDKQQQAYVLEINTAPGLSGITLEGYVRRFRALG